MMRRKLFQYSQKELIELLLNDLEAFNELREGDPNFQPNLERAGLHKANLKGANLRNANLQNADLRMADLSGADLTGADLRSANAYAANLRGTCLNWANLRYLIIIDDTTLLDEKWKIVWKILKSGAKDLDLRGVDLSKADLSEAKLCGADLSGTDLSGSNLKKVDFHETKIDESTLLDKKSGLNWKILNQSNGLLELEGADLSEMILYEADLHGLNLRNAVLIRSDLHRSNLEGANLEGANLAGALLYDSNLRRTNLSGAYFYDVSLSSADLSGAELPKADLREARLNNAVFVAANLSGANLSRQSLYWINFKDANLKGANFSGVGCSNVNLMGANLNSVNGKFRLDLATINQSGRLPPEFLERGGVEKSLSGLIGSGTSVSVTFKREVWGQLFPIERALSAILEDDFIIEKDTDRIVVRLPSPESLGKCLDAIFPVLAGLQSSAPGEVAKVQVNPSADQPETLDTEDTNALLRHLIERFEKVHTPPSPGTEAAVLLVKSIPIIGKAIGPYFERWLKKQEEESSILTTDIYQAYKGLFKAEKKLLMLPTKRKKLASSSEKGLDDRP